MVSPPERTAVTVEVVDREGEPIEGLEAIVCGRSQETDATGRAVGEAWDGHKCTVRLPGFGFVAGAAFAPMNAAAKLDVTGEPLVLTRFSTFEEMMQLRQPDPVEASLAELEALDPVDAILAEPGLSPELRSWFEAESARRAATRAERKAWLEELVRDARARFADPR